MPEPDQPRDGQAGVERPARQREGAVRGRPVGVACGDVSAAAAQFCLHPAAVVGGFIIAAASYYWLNPLYGENLRRAETFEPDWMLYGLARNLGLTIIVSAQSVSASSR